MDLDLRLDGLTLTEPQKNAIALLCRALVSQKALPASGFLTGVREFSDGASGARVVLTEIRRFKAEEPPDRKIFKVAPGWRIRQEIERYEQISKHLKETPGVFTTLVEPRITLKRIRDDDAEAALVYEYAQQRVAGQSDQSLKAFLRDVLQGERSVRDAFIALEPVFAALAHLRKHAQEKPPRALITHYQDRWFPHYEAKVDHLIKAPRTASLLLTSGSRSARDFYGNQGAHLNASEVLAGAESNVEAELRLRDLVKVSAWPGQLRLGSALHPQLRISLDTRDMLPEDYAKALKAPEGGIDVWVQPSASRFSRYHARLKAALPSGFPLDSRVLQVQGWRLHNPVTQMSAPLERALGLERILVAPAHGDLHPGNILIAGLTPVFIDYGLSEDSLPLGVDPIRLFGGIVRDVIASELTLHELIDVLRHTFEETIPATNGSAKQARALELLSWLWPRVRALMGDARELAWLHLYGFAWIGLKWPDEGVGHRACFLMASIAATQLLDPPDPNILAPELEALVAREDPALQETRNFLVRALLRDGVTNEDKLFDTLPAEGASREHLEILLIREPIDAAIIQTRQEGQTLIDLAATPEVFQGVAQRFLLNPLRSDDPLVFIRSQFTQRVLTDSFLNERLHRYVAGARLIGLARRVVRASPSALQLLLQEPSILPVRSFADGKGTAAWLLLKSTLLQDFQRFPALLLEPGLLDEILGGEENTGEDTEHWRVRQIVEYHRALDLERLIEQWGTPDELEEKAMPDPGQEWMTLSLTFQSRDGSSPSNPLEYTAAAARLRLPVQFNETDQLRIRFEVEGEPPEMESNHHRSVVFKPETSRRASIMIPARLLAPERGGYLLRIPWGQVATLKRWTDPLRLHLRWSLPNEEQEAVTVNTTISVNFLLLDCEQAAILIEASRASPEPLSIDGINPKDYKERPPVDFSRIWNLRLEPAQEHEIRQLARIQRLTGESIPFPLLQLPQAVQTLLARPELQTLEEAEALWSSVRQAIDESRRTAPRSQPVTLTPIIVEHYDRHRVLDCIAKEFQFGLHWPRVQLSGIMFNGKLSGEKMERLLDKPHTQMEIPFPIRLSPEAAIRWLVDNRKDLPPERKSVDPLGLQQFKPRGPEEERTWVTLRWMPQQETLWYGVTPLKVRLRALEPWERWVRESSYFLRTRDLRRAWIAANEAWRLMPRHSEAGGQLGWVSFELDRVQEAIATTEEALAMLTRRTAGGVTGAGADEPAEPTLPAPSDETKAPSRQAKPAEQDNAGGQEETAGGPDAEYLHHSNLALYYLRAGQLGIDLSSPEGPDQPQELGGQLMRKATHTLKEAMALERAEAHFRNAIRLLSALDKERRAELAKMTADDLERFRAKLSGPVDALLKLFRQLQSKRLSSERALAQVSVLITKTVPSAPPIDR